MALTRWVADARLADEEVLLDPCSLTARFSSRLSLELVREALNDRLVGIAATSEHSLPWDLTPEVHFHLTLLADSPSLSADRPLAFSHLTLMLEEHLEMLSEMGLKAQLTSQLLRGLRMSALYTTNTLQNTTFITDAAFRKQLGRLDVLLSKSNILAHRPFQVVVYLPDIALLHGRRLRATDSTHRRNDSPSAISGFSYGASGREQRFIIWNDEDYRELYRAITAEFRRWLGLERNYVNELQKTASFNGTFLKFNFDGSGCDSLPALEVWDAHLLEMIWSRRSTTARKVSLSDMERLSKLLPGYTTLPPILLRSSPAAEWSTGISVAGWDTTPWKGWHGEEFTWEQTFVIIAPFWIPLLAPLIKLIRRRIKIKR